MDVQPLSLLAGNIPAYHHKRGVALRSVLRVASRFGWTGSRPGGGIGRKTAGNQRQGYATGQPPPSLRSRLFRSPRDIFRMSPAWVRFRRADDPVCSLRPPGRNEESQATPASQQRAARRYLGPFRLFANDEAWEVGVFQVGEADRPLRRFPRPACRGACGAGQVPEVRPGLRSCRGAAAGVCVSEGGRRHRRGASTSGCRGDFSPPPAAADRPPVLSARKSSPFLRPGCGPFSAPAVLAPYRLLLQRVLRHKPHTLGKKEEKLLAMQTEMAEAARQVFQQLNDADLKFGAVKNAAGSGSS